MSSWPSNRAKWAALCEHQTDTRPLHSGDRNGGSTCTTSKLARGAATRTKQATNMAMKSYALGIMRSMCLFPQALL